MRKQQAISSHFNYNSCAMDVVNGQDLSGKTALITGGHSGLGFQSTKALSSAGAKVIIGARNIPAAKSALANIPNTQVLALDLINKDSVENFCLDVTKLGNKIDIIICNSGIMACPESRTEEGWEMQFATNHIGHYRLVNLLWPIIQSGARVVSVSSLAHHFSPIRWKNIHLDNEYDKWTAYGQSKTANALFALALDEYGKEQNIRAFSVHPGKILTPLQRHLPKEEMLESGWIDETGNLADPTFKTAEQGAATQVWTATSAELNNMGGLYCEDCNIATLASECKESFMGVCDYAVDLDQAKRLWNYTAEITSVNAFAK